MNTRDILENKSFYAPYYSEYKPEPLFASYTGTSFEGDVSVRRDGSMIWYQFCWQRNMVKANIGFKLKVEQ